MTQENDAVAAHLIRLQNAFLEGRISEEVYERLKQDLLSAAESEPEPAPEDVGETQPERPVYDNSQAALRYRVQDTWTDSAGFVWKYDDWIRYEVDGQVAVFCGMGKPYCHYDLNDPQQLEAAAREAIGLGHTEAAFWPPPEPPKPFWDRVLGFLYDVLPGAGTSGGGDCGGGGRDFNAGFGAALDPGEAWYYQQVGKNIRKGMDGK